MFLFGWAIAAGVLVVVALCLALPFLVIGGGVWLALRCIEGLERSAVARPSADAPSRDLGWAAGLLVTGALWLFGAHRFAAILCGLGAGLLARRLAETRSRPTS